MAINRLVSQLITDAAPAAGAAATSGEHDIGDDTLVRGAWLYTTIGATALAAAPSAGNPRIMVSLTPDGTIATGAAHAHDVKHRFVHSLTGDSAHRFADYVDGVLPRFFKVAVLNLTGVAVTASQLDVTIEYIEET